MTSWEVEVRALDRMLLSFVPYPSDTMPSWISIGTTAVASLPDRIFALPLLILSGLFPPLFRICQLLLVPFALVARSIKYIGVLLQTLFLLQAVLFEAFGDGLNS